MNWTTLQADLEAGLALAQRLAPMAAAAGPAAGAAGQVVGAIAGLAAGVLEQATTAGDVLSADDLASIQAACAAIQATNDGLAAQVAAS